MEKRNIIQSIKWLLPLLFITFISGKVFYTHSHLIDDTLVVHSHPFKKGEKTTHNHTHKEYLAIEFHTHGYSTDSIIPQSEINTPFFIVAKQNFIQKEKILFLREVNTNLLRAPPLRCA